MYLQFSMMSRRPLAGGLLVLALLAAGCGGTDSEAPPSERSAERPPDAVRQAVEDSIAAINQMRISLAATIDTPSVDKSTFKRVCAPVGKRAKTLSKTKNWTVQQLAEKYRNPNHTLDAEAREFYETFSSSPDTTDLWVRTARNGVDGWRYARRITVQHSCLACHGPKEQRPDFVKNGYPDDRAYGFEAGDLRGLYAVFVPDSTVTSAP